MYKKYNFSVINLDKISYTAIGIYAFWYKERCIYVGQAKDQPIRKRLYQHYKYSHNDKLRLWIEIYNKQLNFCIFQLPYRKINGVEKNFIWRLQPVANIQLKNGK